MRLWSCRQECEIKFYWDLNQHGTCYSWKGKLAHAAYSCIIYNSVENQVEIIKGPALGHGRVRSQFPRTYLWTQVLRSPQLYHQLHEHWVHHTESQNPQTASYTGDISIAKWSNIAAKYLNQINPTYDTIPILLNSRCQLTHCVHFPHPLFWAPRGAGLITAPRSSVRVCIKGRCHTKAADQTAQPAQEAKD